MRQTSLCFLSAFMALPVAASPVPPVTDADREAAFQVLAHSHAHATPPVTYVEIGRLEGWDGGQAWEALSWTGGDVHRLWLRTHGEREDGKLRSADLEVLYGRAHGPWWDVVTGVRHDFRPHEGKSRTWAALGVQGLAPYKFEVALTAYASGDGQAMVKAGAEYDILLTNDLIVQPSAEVSAFGKDDALRREGAGVSSVEAGVRLRYRLTRQFAPYAGVSYEKSFGKTADYRRERNDSTSDTRWIAGLSLWF